VAAAAWLELVGGQARHAALLGQLGLGLLDGLGLADVPQEAGLAGLGGLSQALLGIDDGLGLSIGEALLGVPKLLEGFTLIGVRLPDLVLVTRLAGDAASPQGKLESAKRFHILAAQAQAAARKTGNKDKIREANANEGEAFQELRNAEQGLADAQAQAIIDAQKRLTQATEACKARLLRDIREAQAVEQAQAKLAKERCVARLAADKLQPGRRGHKVGYYVPLRIAAAA
jgi:hypothetical protein